MESKETEELTKELTHCARLDAPVWKVLEITQGSTDDTKENTTKNYEKLAPRHLDFQSKFFLLWSQFLQMMASALQHDEKDIYNFMKISLVLYS
jgi:hypothetical protein